MNLEVGEAPQGVSMFSIMNEPANEKDLEM